MVNVVLRKKSYVGNSIIWPKQMCRFSCCMCIVLLFVTAFGSQGIAAGFNSGSSTGRLSASNLRRKNVQNATSSAAGKRSRANPKDGKVQASKEKSEDLTIDDSPSWADKRSNGTVDRVEYYYFRTYSSTKKYHEGEYDVVVLENNRQCAINITDDRTTLVLPESLGGLPLVALGSGSCMNLVDVEVVKLPSSIRQIGDYAFEGCSSLKSIVLPTHLRIKAEAFKDCENLETIDFHDGISVDLDAFKGWTGLKEIALPEGLKQSLPSFSGCTALKTIKLPKRIMSDGVNEMWMSFRDCKSLESIVLPVGFDRIPPSAFENCEKLVSITLPDTIKKIEFFAFMGCSSLKEIKLPYKITKIDTALFKGCSSLESIAVPENVETIEPNAFAGCTALKEIILPASIKSIANGAFDGCHSIKKIKMPVSVRDWVLNLRMDNLYDSKKLKDRTEIQIEIINE